jgi:hypothetical protein
MKYRHYWAKSEDLRRHTRAICQDYMRYHPIVRENIGFAEWVPSDGRALC